MGLCVNIENWTMPAAIGLATEAIRGKSPDGGAGGGGYGAADINIGTRLDGGKVLAVLGVIQDVHPHLSDWAFFAYASPLWNETSLTKRFLEHLFNDWVIDCSFAGINVTDKTASRIRCILPFIAGGFSLEQTGGARIDFTDGELCYDPVTKRSLLIEVLVDHDCALEGVTSETFKKKRKRYYQNNWPRLQSHIDMLIVRLMGYDQLSKKLFKKGIEN